jgi:hypothetical protein
LKNYTNNIYFLDEKFLQELKTATDRRKWNITLIL